MSIPYNPEASSMRFFIPKTLADDFDTFLNNDIPNVVMDFSLHHDWYDQFAENYEPNVIRAEIYPNATKSRYENMDNMFNFRASVTSGIRKGDIVVDPENKTYLLDWQIEPEMNNASTRALSCNINLTVYRRVQEVIDSMGYCIEPEHDEIIVDRLPSNISRNAYRMEYNVIKSNPGVSPNSIADLFVQVNDHTKNIKIGDKFIWGASTYIIIDIDYVGVTLDGDSGVIMYQARKEPGGEIE